MPTSLDLEAENGTFVTTRDYTLPSRILGFPLQHPQLERIVPVIVATASAICAGAAVALYPAAGLLAVVPLALLAMVQSPFFRTAFVAVGGVLVLQSSAGLSLGKLAYLAGALFALALSSARLGHDPTYMPLVRPLLIASGLLAMVLVFSLPTAHTSGTPFSFWMRDIAPYALFACAPIFAFDLWLSHARRGVVVLLVILGLAAGASFSLEWLSRRGFVAGDLTAFALPSFFLVSALLAYAFSIVVSTKEARTRSAWLLLAVTVVFMLVLTGTRSLVLLFVLPLAVVFLQTRNVSRTVLRVAALLTVGGALVVFLVSGASSGLGGPTTALERLRSTAELPSGFRSDPSFQDRTAQTEAAWRAFISNPLTGVGPGYAFEFASPYPRGPERFAIDTPLVIPAKLGLMGLAALAVILGSYATYARRVMRIAPGATGPTALAAYLSLGLLWLMLGSPFEDKGFGLGLLLLLALSLPSEQGASDQESRSPANRVGQLSLRRSES